LKLINQSHEILSTSGGVESIEQAARTCYKSEDKMKEGSDVALFERLRKSGHHAMLEFGDATVRFITNRGVTHELVRHRLCSFAQESTRYCNYGKDKFDNQVTFIKPVWFTTDQWGFGGGCLLEDPEATFIRSLKQAETNYFTLLDNGWSPQEAREVLPNALKTEIVVKANLREWRHIFKLRCSGAAHPQIRDLMIRCLCEMNDHIPYVFEDLAKEQFDV
jgi:thymidylate synthase (FAD)